MRESFHDARIDILRTPSQDAFQTAMRLMVIGWQQYAVAYREKYQEPIADDEAIALAYKRIGEELQHMLWGDIGDLNFSLVEKLIKEVLVENGY